MRPIGEAQSKAMRAYTQSGQYHIIVESRVRLTLFSHGGRRNHHCRNSSKFQSHDWAIYLRHGGERLVRLVAEIQEISDDRQRPFSRR